MSTEALAKGNKFAGRYVLERLLHTSDHHAIWLAHDATLNSLVVLKVASKKNSLAVRLIDNEYRHSSQCIHPYVARVFERDSFDDFVFLTVEYLPGGNFTELIGRSSMQFIPPMLQIAEALADVHAQGIVHRDVKLSNMLFDSRRHARLIDFEIASQAGADGLRSGGSPRCMSPQQRSNQAPSIQDDVYSFGVSLYRLLEGAWPDDKLTFQTQEPELQALITELLDQEPGLRPRDMQTVMQRLQHAMTAQSNATLPPDEYEFDSSESEAVDVIELPQSNATHSGDEPPSEDASNRGRWMFLLTLYGGLAAIALLYFLPRMAPENTAAQPTLSESAPSSTTGAPNDNPGSAVDREDVEPWKLAQEARLRKEAEDSLERLLESQFQLEDRQAPIWAAKEFSSIKALAVEGDQLFRGKQYEDALGKYVEAHEIAKQLQVRAETILPDTLAAGEAAIEAADSAAATMQFTLALQIEPGSQQASKGLERAAALDELVALVARAEILERDGDIDKALALFRQASKLDPDWQAASDGVSRLANIRARQAFSNQMTRGYQALERGDFSTSREAFNRAQALSPKSAEVQDALNQLNTAIRLQDVSSSRSRAESLEQSGRWREAEQEYRKVLGKDPSQTTREALRRVTARADAEEQLDALLGDPLRLSNDSVYLKAEELLGRLQAYRGDSVLASKEAQLRELMLVANTPVDIQLSSDGQTTVLLYRVGQLGTFQSKALQLRPGSYTAVGTRAGYRDVRVEFSITPGETPETIVISCRETI